MSSWTMTDELGEAAILGGAVLGGGGGGSMVKGRRNVTEALSLGRVTVMDIDDIAPETLLVTSSAVGAPAARDAEALPQDYIRVVELLRANGCPKPGGFIPNECGGSSITNGWIPAALMGLPVVDALCNGRAHPTGAMGSMGLHRDPNYVSLQAVAGGSRARGLYIEMHAKGRMDVVAPLVRAAAVSAGGLVAVARNPVTAAFVKKNGAPGALRQAVELGRRMQSAADKGGECVVRVIADFLGGEIVTRGRVSALELRTEGGFDVGSMTIDGYELTFWNEFMTLERGKERIATFPDLIMILSAEKGLPVTTAELMRNDEVFLLRVPAWKLILGEAMRCKDLMEAVEPIIGKQIVAYGTFS